MRTSILYRFFEDLLLIRLPWLLLSHVQMHLPDDADSLHSIVYCCTEHDRIIVFHNKLLAEFAPGNEAIDAVVFSNQLHVFACRVEYCVIHISDEELNGPGGVDQSVSRNIKSERPFIINIFVALNTQSQLPYKVKLLSKDSQPWRIVINTVLPTHNAEERMCCGSQISVPFKDQSSFRWNGRCRVSRN